MATSGWRARSFLRLEALRSRLTENLFFVPFLMLAGSIALSQIMVWIDRSMAEDVLPGWFSVTVGSSRSILSAIAGGTITAASIVFSLTLVAVQLAASQFSPRVLRGFLGDRFQQLVMGTVIGTFSYSLLVLREVRSATEDIDRAFLPQLSVATAVVLSVASMVAILGSIDHTAKSLRVGSVADEIMRSTLEVIERNFSPRLASEGSSDDGEAVPVLVDAPSIAPSPPGTDLAPVDHHPPDDARLVLAPRTGWVTALQAERLLECVPDGGTVLVSAAVGTFVVEGTPIASVWPADLDDVDRIVHELPSMLLIEDSRTMQQDVSFGLIQMNDIALRALSPGVNDPNTANEVIVRVGAILTAIYRMTLPPVESTDGKRRVLRPVDPSHGDYVEQAFEPIRRYARSDPRVLEVIARTIQSIISDVHRRFGAAVDVEPLTAQLRMMWAEADELATEEDRRRVRSVLRETIND